MLDLSFRLLNEHARLPESQNSSAGLDIRTIYHVTLPPGQTKVISTGVALAKYPNPRGHFLKVEGRSSLAARGIAPLGGVIDPDYRGEIKIILTNHSDTQVTLDAGNRIAQLVPYQIPTSTNVIEVNVSDSTQRGEGGFGSTGER